MLIRILFTRSLFFIYVALSLAAQQSASISGSVYDQSGAAIYGVTFKLTDSESGASRETATDTHGRYAFLQLTASTYDLTAEKAGFKTAEKRRIAVATNQGVDVDMTLTLGPVSERVQVTEAAPSVAPVIEPAPGLVDGAQIRDLPLNGRSYDQLLTLNPGVANYSYEKNNNTPGISNSALGNMFAVSGRRPQENLFLVEGVEYTGSAEINMTPSGTSGELLGVDAIREFNVLTDFYGAEYGKRPGAQILIVDRSGTNQFHGSGYEFLRNSAFDARNFFDRESVPQFQRNQFGGSLGGPVAPNRTFLFGDYEGFRQNLRLSDVTLVPNNKARAGILPNGNRVVLSPRVEQLLSLWPVQSPNSPLDSQGIAEAFSTPKQTIREDFGTTRLDHIFSIRDTLAASYTVDDSADRTPTANPLALDVESLREQVATLRETHIFSPNVINTATVGYSRASYFYTGESAVNVPGFIGNDQIGAIVIGGSATPNTSSSITMAGSNNGSHLFATRNLFTYQDQVSIVRGIHQITAGGWFQRIQSNDELALGQYGQATFSSLTNFILGTVSTFTAIPSPTSLGWRSWEGAGFVEDQIRPASGLTLSLGLRDEFTTGWNEVMGRASTFVFGPDGALETQPRVSHAALTVNRAKFLPQPRVGFAWNPARLSKTVIRGGFGLYNDLQDALSYRLDQNAPFNTNITLSNTPLTSFPIFPGSIPTNSKIAPAGIEPDLYTPTVVSWTLKVQQQLTPNTSLSVGYVGSHAYHETLSADLNQPVPTICPVAPCPASYAAGTIYNRLGAPLANPALASTWTWISQGSSSFNAMEVDLRRRFTSGLNFRTAYTWSKSLDNGDTLNASASANAPGLAQNFHDLRNDWGPSTFDARQVLTVTGIYELPFGPGKRWLGSVHGLTKTLFSGWSLNGIENYNSGFPFTPQLSFNPSNNGNTTNPVRPSLNPSFAGLIVTGNPNQFFNPNAFVVPPNGTYGNVGRNAFTGPGLVTLDASLMKTTVLHERLSLQLRGEVFNALNHANFNTPNLIVFTSAAAPPSGSAGVITSTSTSSRQIQIAAKLIW
ncbi:MAG: carboxypeptidase-like regulatory domain-containing protein [Acidobacteriota bacterium]|nr:carboxypeptidase-like regulatory domain-containing protein [Acidobacteriota bacterium]